jgi:hypothetical protein
MATPEEFAVIIVRVAQQVETGADRVIREVALAAHQAVVMATPVDTGRARANWEVSINRPVTTHTEGTNYVGTLGAGAATIATRRNSQSIHISNNVPYIGELNRGSSAQAPANFVQRAVQAAAAKVGSARVIIR